MSKDSSSKPTRIDSKIELVEGCKAMVFKSDEGVYKRAEIISARLLAHSEPPIKQYYVHYVDYNRRLDHWVGLENIDMKTVETPPPPAATNSRKETPSKKRPSTGGRKRKSVAIDSSLAASQESPLQSSNILKRVDSCDTLSSLLPSTAAPPRQPLVIPQTGSIRSAAESANESVVTKVKNIQLIQLGKHRVSPWYFSPYPVEFRNCPVLYICEFCLTFRSDEHAFRRHCAKCRTFHPPGIEIYRQQNLSFFEVDGRVHSTYSQNLCLLSKLFLDHKTLYYDTDPFLFYILTEINDTGFHLVGYFSKEKESADEYNLACILTLPQFQRNGYGKLLIEFSYMLSMAENKVGHPEKPFSDLGLLSYRSYWTQTITRLIVNELQKARPNEKQKNNTTSQEGDRKLLPTTTTTPEITIGEIVARTAIRKEDVIGTLQYMDILHYFKGQFVICITKNQIDALNKAEKKRVVILDSSFLKWTPRNHS